MTIHHAIVKSAAGRGVVFAYPGDNQIEATHQATGAKVVLDVGDEESENDVAKEAWVQATDMGEFNTDTERNKGYTISQEEDGVFVVSGNGDAGEPFDTLEEAIAFVDEQEADEPDDDEAEAGGSVVPAHFKVLYREIGVRGQDNGDFLARLFAQYCVILSGKDEVIDCDRVEILASRNGVDYPLDGYNTGSRGWQGRYRMTVRNMLAKRVADNRVCVVPASLNEGTEIEHTPDETFIAKFATKPKSKGAKKEAAKAAAELVAD